MNLLASYYLYAGGPGSGCKGPNCGRPSEQGHGALKMPRGRMTIRRIDKELKEAAQNKKVVLIEYKADDAEKSKTYMVEPYSYRKSTKEDKFYFFGYDQTAKSIKAFNVMNIVRVSPLGRTFKPRWKIEIGGGENAKQG